MPGVRRVQDVFRGHETRTLLHCFDIVRLLVRNLDSELLQSPEQLYEGNISYHADLFYSHDNFHGI